MNCCFTGHRPQHFSWGNNESDERCIKLKNLLNETIEQAISDGYTDFYSGMALGTDIFAAEIVLDKAKENPQIKLHAVIPCVNQPDRWNKSERTRYRQILKHCATKTIISPFYTESCMLLRNQFMVDNCLRVISVWNGSFVGGTAYTVRYAKKMNRELYNINPKEFTITVH